LDLDEGIMSAVNAHDIFSVLVVRLTPIDQSILVALVAGVELGEIAEKLHVSYKCVIRHRRGIAKEAVKLGINPLAASPPPRSASN
jgi:DNA-binding NarL/FixJ family response regulator